nr:WPP domain-associated protein [Quercus suber]
MDEFFGGMDGRFRVSLTDSTMMCIVHQAMDKAHEKVKSKEGVVERLNEISKFYELAVMQLEGCLKFVQDETDNCVLDSDQEEVLADLTEIRDRLQGRLKESELAISEKDREELVSLRAKLELERTKSEGIEEFVLGDEDRDGEFCELKHSVDEQVRNIKQKLGPDYKLIGEERNRGIDNKKIEQMGLDIDMLKETLDLAFAKMQSAIFLSRIGPIEQQWRWSIEKDTIYVLIKGLMRNFQESFEAKVKKQVLIGLNEHWSDLMNEVESLRCELEPLCSQNDMQGSSVKAHNASAAPSLAGGNKISNVEGEKSSPENDCNRTGKSSLKVEEADHKEKLTEKEQEVDESHHVAKMIKNHESFIQKKSEELNWLKREILREKEFSFRREKDTQSLKRRIQEVVVRLDNLMDWNTKLGKTLGYHEAAHGDENFLGKRELQFRENTDNLADVWEKIDKVTVSYVLREEQRNEIWRLRQDKEDAYLQTMIMEEIHITLLKGLMKEVNIESYYYDLENLIREDIYKDMFREMVRQWNENFESDKIDAQIRKEIFFIVFSEALKNYVSNRDFALLEFQDIGAVSNLVEDLTSTNKLFSVEGAVGEDLQAALFGEIFKEQSKCAEGYITESLNREEIDRVVFGETIKSIVSTTSTREFFLSAESLVKEDVCMLLFREMVKELKMGIDAYNMESLIWEDIFKFVTAEAVKDAFVLHREDESRIQDNLNGDMLSPNKIYNDLQDTGEGNLIQQLDSLSQSFQLEENLMLSASSELKEYTTQLDLLGLKSEETDGHQIFEEFPIDEEHTFSSVSGKLEKALQQLVSSKSLLGELGSCLGVGIGDLEEGHDQMTPRVGVQHAGHPSFHSLKDNEEEQLDTPDSILSPLLGFMQVLVDFEHMVHKKLRMNILRLEEVKYNLDPLIGLVASLRNEELLYRKAFVRKCQNLQKAELEVDLLGDQVDVLLGLLEKIYTTLQHYSPALQQYFEVSDILNLIKEELTGRPPVYAPVPTPTPSSPPTIVPPQSPPPPTNINVPPPTTQGSSSSSSSRGLNGGQKAGIAVGVMSAAEALFLGGLVYKKRRSNIRRAKFGVAARRPVL